jgi:hypothetical protein
MHLEEGLTLANLPDLGKVDPEVGDAATFGNETGRHGLTLLGAQLMEGYSCGTI